YSGAEIEQAIISALHEAFAEKQPLDTARVVTALENSPPLSVTMAEKVAALRHWAAQRCVPAERGGRGTGSRRRVNIRDDLAPAGRGDVATGWSKPRSGERNPWNGVARQMIAPEGRWKRRRSIEDILLVKLDAMRT